MALQTKQSFLKGINRRFPRDESTNTDFFYTLQNARIFNRGDTGKVQRIKGFDKFNSTTTDYSNILDFVEFLGNYIALYEDATSSGTFWIEVFDSAGSSVYSQSYTDNTTDEGKLTTSSDTVFIAPHNKVLYYDGANWILEDFISTVPTITGTNQGTAAKASASFEPTSTIDVTNNARKATAKIDIRRNNTVVGQPDSFTITVGGNTTDQITINYEDTVRGIAQEFYYALKGGTSPKGVTYSDPGITTDWDISLLKNQLNSFSDSSSTVYLTAQSTGSQRNNDEITIDGSEYTIINKNLRNLYTEGDRLLDDGTTSGIDITETTSTTLDIAQPSGGVDKNSAIIGPLYMRFNNIDYTVQTENIINITTTLAEALDSTETAVDVNDASDIKVGDNIQVNSEEMSVDGISTNTLTVTRGVNGTTAASHSSGDDVILGTSKTITNRVETALNNDSTITDKFTVSRSGNVITIDSNNFGKEYNGKIALRFFGNKSIKASDLFSYNKSDFSGGKEVEENLTLDRHTDYWYKARYKYIDGHISEDCFPIKLNTGASKSNTVNFDTPDLDLDGTRPRLQIFRKEEGEPFFLIDEIDISSDTTSYLDDGKLEKGEFEGVNLIWTKSHKTHAILDDRYIRANIEYFDEQYTDVTSSDFTLGTTSTTNDESLPNNTKVRFFIQPQYTDGTKGYFQDIGFLDVGNTGLLPTIDQDTVLNNSDKTIEELGIYANYKPHAEEHITRFNSVEIANENISTIADSSFFPSQTRILLGFKYIEIYSLNDFSRVLKVAGWDSVGKDTDHSGFIFNFGGVSGEIDGNFPRKLTIEMFGLDFQYVRHGYRDSIDEGEVGVYKLDNFEAIKKAIQTGDLKVRLRSSNVGNLSEGESDKDILGTEVKVKKLIDKSAQYKDLDIYTEEQDFLVGPYDTRIYIELEESIYDEIDNENLTKYGLRKDYKAHDDPYTEGGDFTGFPSQEQDMDSYTMAWEFTNLKEVSDSTFDPYNKAESSKDGGRPEDGAYGRTFYRYSWDYKQFELSNITYLDNEELLVFLGRKENQNDSSAITLNVTGFTFEEDDELNYAKLRPSNIYQKIFTKSDLNINKKNFENQLVWSGKLRQETGFSGGRTFKNESFFNIGSENGDILDVETLGNKLFVFCERGLAVVNVGEVLTTQKGGEVKVDSSTFMTNYYWISDKLMDVKRESIIKYKNNIFFSDGYDVYALSGENLQNLTQGIIDLDADLEYYGAINPEKNEYQLCEYSTSTTWVFNFEFKQWYGPFTYKFKKGDYLRKQFITVDANLREHEIGNTFDGASFTTLIESVASDNEDSFFDKNFRKFYIQTQNDTNATFYYGKDPASLISVGLSSMEVKNGYKHQGIKPSEQNTKTIFWEIESTDSGFELSDISWRFSVKRRR